MRSRSTGYDWIESGASGFRRIYRRREDDQQKNRLKIAGLFLSSKRPV
jgi:hypothetical protein